MHHRSAIVLCLLALALSAAVSACPRPARLPGCARLYASTNVFFPCYGASVDVADGGDITDLGYLDDAASVAVVRPGCVLTAFDDVRFGGAKKSFAGRRGAHIILKACSWR